MNEFCSFYKTLCFVKILLLIASSLTYISRTLGLLSGTKYWFSLDLSDTFCHIPLAKTDSDSDKKAFTVLAFSSLSHSPFSLHGSGRNLCRSMVAHLNYDLEP